ncbi:hypothetical protein LINPERHAP1_LOCUS17163 [Linum perenne]
MTFNKDLFKDLIPTTQLRVKISDGTYLPVKGKGAIKFVTSRGSKQFTDVLYVPDLDQNMLNATQLMAKGYKVFLRRRCVTCTMVHGRKFFVLR